MKTYSLSELATRDDRRDHIAKLMLSGEWTGAGSRRALAEGWGVRLAEVYQLEGEAAGGIRQARRPGWEDEVVGALAQLDELIALCRTMQKPVVVDKEVELYDWPAVSVMHNAIKTKLQVYGALGQPLVKKPEQADQEFNDLPPAEKRAILQQALAELDGKEARH